MTRLGLKARCLVLGMTVALGASGSAGAQAGTVVWNFSGNCVDCAAAAGTPTFGVTGTLTLLDYIQGTALVDDNFVSFFYGGSNLMLPYVVDEVGGSPPPVHHSPGLSDFITGNLTNGGSQVLNLYFGDGLEFTMDVDGNWFTCGTNGSGYYEVPCSWQNNTDNGNLGGLAVPTPGTNTVPEPGTYALMTAGLAALAFASRRRQRTR